MRLESVLTDVTRRAPVRGRELFKVTVAVHVAAVDACPKGKWMDQKINKVQSVSLLPVVVPKPSRRYTNDDRCMNNHNHNHNRRHPSSSRTNPKPLTVLAGPIPSRIASHRIAHESSSHAQMYGVVSTAPPEAFPPPPKLKNARIGATVVVRPRRPPLVETVDRRVVTLVPVANVDVDIAIVIATDIVSARASFCVPVRRFVRPTFRPSPVHPGDDRLKKTTPGRSRKKGWFPNVGRSTGGPRLRVRKYYLYTESTVHKPYIY